MERPPAPAPRFIVINSVQSRLRAFRLGFKESSYIEGANVTVQYHFGPTDRSPELAAELVNQHVALIATTVGAATFAARTATTTIPIVFLVGQDPVKLGLVTSLVGRAAIGQASTWVLQSWCETCRPIG
jgi:putative ABC transport system substrate-binding protein